MRSSRFTPGRGQPVVMVDGAVAGEPRTFGHPIGLAILAGKGCLAAERVLSDPARRRERAPRDAARGASTTGSAYPAGTSTPVTIDSRCSSGAETVSGSRRRRGQERHPVALRRLSEPGAAMLRKAAAPGPSRATTAGRKDIRMPGLTGTGAASMTRARDEDGDHRGEAEPVQPGRSRPPPAPRISCQARRRPSSGPARWPEGAREGGRLRGSRSGPSVERGTAAFVLSCSQRHSGRQGRSGTGRRVPPRG